MARAAGRRKGGKLIPTPDQTGMPILRLARTPPPDLGSLLIMQKDGRLW
jgi:hypothetical protein